MTSKLSRVNDVNVKLLLSALNRIRAWPRSESELTPGGSLVAPLAALIAVTKFLDAVADVPLDAPGHGPTGPLWDLIVALRDVSVGIAHPLLTPPKIGRRAKSLEQQAMQGWSAILFDCLQKEGKNRQDAGDFVAKELQAITLTQGANLRTASGNTVANWINQLRDRESAAPQGARLAWTKYIQGREADGAPSPDAWTQWALSGLRELVKNRLILESPPAKTQG